MVKQTEHMLEWRKLSSRVTLQRRPYTLKEKLWLSCRIAKPSGAGRFLFFFRCLFLILCSVIAPVARAWYLTTSWFWHLADFGPLETEAFHVLSFLRVCDWRMVGTQDISLYLSVICHLSQSRVMLGPCPTFFVTCKVLTVKCPKSLSCRAIPSCSILKTSQNGYSKRWNNEPD